MRIHVEIPAQEVAALRQLTNTDNDADAVARAAREFLEAIEMSECNLPL